MPKIDETKAKTKKIADLEKRIAELEAKKCPMCKTFEKYCEKGCPNQGEVREWIKDNPFLVLGAAVLVIMILVAIF